AAILEGALAAAPPSLQPQVRRYLAQAQISAGRSERAVAALAGHTGDDPSLLVLLARAHFQAGDAKQSLAVLDAVAGHLLAAGPTRGDESVAADVALVYGTAAVALSLW